MMKLVVLFAIVSMAFAVDPVSSPAGLEDGICPNFPFCGPTPQEAINFRRVQSQAAVAALSLTGLVSLGSRAPPVAGPAQAFPARQGPPPDPRSPPTGYSEQPSYSSQPATTYSQPPSYSQPPAYSQAPAYSQPPTYSQPPAYSQPPSYGAPAAVARPASNAPASYPASLSTSDCPNYPFCGPTPTDPPRAIPKPSNLPEGVYLG